MISIPDKIKAKFANAPKKPGVYLYKNASGKVIYVGKAVNLESRTKSYFANYSRLDPRIQTMVDEATDIEYLVVDTEVEALILEMNLIKKYKTPYNVSGRDDKGYLWVKINSQFDFPTVETVRNREKDKADYFGPFPDVGPVRRMLKDLRRVFKYCTNCEKVKEVVDGGGQKKVVTPNKKPCFYYHIDLCSGACVGKLSKIEYRKQVNELKQFLRSEHKDLKKSYKEKMHKFAKDKNYEKAAEYRDRLRDLEYVTHYQLIDAGLDDDAYKKQVEKNQQMGVVELVKAINMPGLFLNEEDASTFRIECYDISNIQGTNATSAMVVSIGGKLSKKNYRKFKIKTKSTPDDFAMLREVLKRRMKYLLPDDQKPKKLDESFVEKPGLIVIDGGKGQVSSVLKVMENYGLKHSISIPIIGIAKKQEELVIPEGKDGFRIVKLSRRSSGLKIVQNLRDEAHRFGLGYHRLLRSKGMVYSELDLIPGVGEVTKQRLIKAFGSVDGIKKAKFEELNAIVKNKSTVFKLKKLLD